MGFTYDQRWLTYADGRQAAVCIVRLPADSLRFSTATQTIWRARLRDAAHLRRYQLMVRGAADPVVIAWARLEQDLSVTEFFPGAEPITHEGEHILSANSWITYVLRRLLGRGELGWCAGTWEVAADASPRAWRAAAQQVVAWLADHDRLWLDVGPGRVPPASLSFEDFDPFQNLLALGPCGFVRDYAADVRPRAVFNTAFFLLEHDDFVCHHSALGEPYGLAVMDGVITRPPLYRRAAIWRTSSGGWQTGPVGMREVAVILPGGTRLGPANSHDSGLSFSVNTTNDADVILFTRFWGVTHRNRVLGVTPARGHRLEITVMDRRIVGWKIGGGLLIPQNGFVLSFNRSALTGEQVQSLQHFSAVQFQFASSERRAITWAVQCGPQLLQDGKVVLNSRSLVDEEFWTSRHVDGQHVVGVVPTDYPEDIDRTRAGRVGLGIDREGDLVIVAVPGTSKHATQTSGDSAGATLTELSEFLLAAGAVEAINLDGGGSTQLFIDGGLFARQGDRRGYDGVVFDRMVPSLGVGGGFGKIS